MGGAANNTLTLHPPGNMAKLLCMLAWAGAVTAAPTSSWNPSSSGRLGGSEDALVARVMGSLGPSINSAIAAAMGGLSSGATLTRGSPVTTFQGSVTNGPATSVQFSGTSKGVNSQSKWTSSTSSSKESSFSSSTIGGTGLTGSAFGSSGFGSSSLLGSSGLSGFGSSGLSTSGFGSSSGLSSSSFGTGSSLGSSSSSKFGSSSSLSQGQVVESVLSALGPSITSAVEAAPAEQGSKTTT